MNTVIAGTCELWKSFSTFHFAQNMDAFIGGGGCNCCGLPLLLLMRQK